MNVPKDCERKRSESNCVSCTRRKRNVMAREKKMKKLRRKKLPMRGVGNTKNISSI